jgi:hypothetical protein
MKKKKRVNWSIVVSMVLSITAILVSLLRVIDTYKISDTSYISIIVTLMGICATFIVCYQIYTGITMHERIKKLEKLEDSISNWEQLKYEVEGNLEISKGFLFQSKEEIERAFICYQIALHHFFMSNNENKINDMLTNLEFCLKGFRGEVTQEVKDMINDCWDKIEATENYKLYKTRYFSIKETLKLINNE